MPAYFLRGALLLLIAALAVPAAAQDEAKVLHVSVTGAVHRPGEQQLPAGARLADAVLAAMPDPRAYPLGAALLRRDAILPQTRTRAGLLYDLQTLQESAAAGTPGLATVAARLQEWLRDLPLTGRIPNLLEPRALEVDPGANRPLADGDRIVYPLRPTTVRVLGAVAQACQPTHVPLRDASDYLRDCPPLAAAADRDWLYAIQPDGHVQRLGIAAWNRSAPYPLAPGAIVYVPLRERELRGLDAGFNADFAGFLATQLLPAPGDAQ